MLVALSGLGDCSGRQTFTVSEVYREMVTRGTSYAEPTVSKIIQRMKDSPVRPPCQR